MHLSDVGSESLVPVENAFCPVHVQYRGALCADFRRSQPSSTAALFHGRDLIGATLSTLASGGSVILPPRFSASEFLKLLREHHATWYSAVPTIHQVL
jgi:hypothetical protein